MRPLCAATPQDSADPDKAWEVFLALLRGEDVVMPRRLRPPLLMFATRLAEGAFTIGCDSSGTPAEEMSSRAAKVRRVLGAITDSSYPPRRELDILETRCMVLEGRLEEVEAILDQYCGRDLTSKDALNATPIVQISQAMAQAIDVLHGPEAAYDWIVSRWGVVEQYVWKKPSLIYSRASRIAIASLRNTLIRAVERIEHPGDFLKKRIRTRPDGPWKDVGDNLIDSLCVVRHLKEALDVVRRMERLSIPPSVNVRLMLVKALAKETDFRPAHELYDRVCKDTKGVREAELREVWSAGLYLHAMEGNVALAGEDFTRLEGRNWVNFEIIALMLRATAAKGLVKKTIETFERFFPRGAEPSRLKYGKPTMAHYTEVLLAHARAGDMDRIHLWIKRMINDKIVPDAYTYVMLLKGFASSNDVPSLTELLRRIKSSGVKLNIHGYTTIISFLARTGDSVGAERTFQQALKDGIKPDIKMLNALMYSHVQSGYWPGVIDVFNHIKTLPGKRYRPTTATYNTVLKAYVLIGTPFSTISGLVAEQEALGTRPDAHSFALLVQSACDHKEFDVALGLLDHMDRVDSGVEVTVYVLSILMGTFLRHGNKVRAREVFAQMKSRNIVPTAITYSKIIHAYAQEGTSETLQLGEAFLRKLISEESEDDGLRAGWMSSSGGRSLALETLYQPLMHIYAKLRRVEDVERLQQELLDQGGRTTLGSLTALLAAYGNNGDVEAGKQTWSLIFDIASQRSNLGAILYSDESGSKDHHEYMSQSNILCVPLSIYIDLLSSTGHHTEVAKVWDELRTRGFTFDSHNWNHLIIALIRAGEPERAFTILERVILPNMVPAASSTRETEYGRTSRQRNSPLSIVGGRNEVSLPGQDGSPVEPPAWGETTVHRHNRRMEGIRQVSEHLESHPTIEIGPRDDFAHRLETLQLIPFTWNSWRPHAVTLSVLSQALARLASGRLLRPIPSDSSPVTPTNETTPISDSAKDVLNRIYANCRGGVRAVKDFERRENDWAAESTKDGQSIRWT